MHDVIYRCVTPDLYLFTSEDALRAFTGRIFWDGEAWHYSTEILGGALSHGATHCLVDAMGEVEADWHAVEGGFL